MDYLDFYNNHKCLICDRHCKNRRSLGNHLHKAHDSSIEKYVTEYMFGNIVPCCKCKCGQKVNWHKSKYKYNDYISGHNDTGFDISKYKHTKEDIEIRGNAIKKAYLEKGSEISEKISTSVKKAWLDPEKVKNNSDGKKALWKDENYHNRMSKVRKSVWDEQGDELRKKIFTPEFGRKISLANMRRDNKRTSKKENAFLKHVRDIGIDITEGKWINRDGLIKHYDGYIYEKRLLVEYDGVYWHGLDRKRDFTRDQVINITNDFVKNRLAIEEGWGLLRIPEDVDLSRIVDLESLIDCAYHYQDSDGKIIKDGVFRIEDGEALITRERLLRIHLDKGVDYISDNFLNVVINFMREYVNHHGWFYPLETETLEDAERKIIKNLSYEENVFSSLGSDGTSYLKSCFSSYWDVSGGPVDSFWSGNHLERVTKYRLGINNSKPYKYKLDNVDVYCNETFDISFKNIRRGFVVQRRAVSFFKPKVACEIYSKFLEGAESPVVWDPSSGFGARMLGFYTFLNGKDGKYIGMEPADKTYNDLLFLRGELLAKNPNMDCKINQGVSEDYLDEKEGSVDLVFTSPPYFDKEKYFDDDTQCWKRYSNFEMWKEKYLLPTFENAYRVLKKDGTMIINVDKKLSNHVVAKASYVGFKLEQEMKLNVSRDHFAKKRGLSKDLYEPILVFSKA